MVPEGLKEVSNPHHIIQRVARSMEKDSRKIQPGMVAIFQKIEIIESGTVPIRMREETRQVTEPWRSTERIIFRQRNTSRETAHREIYS